MSVILAVAKALVNLTIGCPRMQNILCYTRYSIVQKLSTKQSTKVIYRFDNRLRTAHSKSQKAV